MESPTTTQVVVGHSLGCISALIALDRLRLKEKRWRCGGLILVAGFSSRLEGIPQLDEFTGVKIDMTRIIASTPLRVVIHSDNDGVVPPEHSRRLAAELEARVVEVPGAMHFMDREGVTSLPTVESHIRRVPGFERSTPGLPTAN